MFNEFSEKNLQEKLEALQRMLERSNNATQREGIEKKIIHVRCELEFKIANREQRATNKRPKAPVRATQSTPSFVAVAASEAPGVPAAPHGRRQKIADDARAAADILLQKLSDALRKAEESRRREDAVRRDATATRHDKQAAIDRTLADEQIAQDFQKKADSAVVKADRKEADVRKAEAKATAHQSNLSLANRQPSFQTLTDSQRPLTDSRNLQDGNGQTSETRIAQLAMDREKEAEAENARLAEEAKQAEAENARLAEEAKQAEATAKAEGARLKAKAKQASKDAQMALWHKELDQCHSATPEFKQLACDNGTTRPHVLVSNDVLDSTSLSLAIAALAFTEELEGQFSIVTDTLQLLSRLTNQHGITCLQKPDTLIIPLLLSKDETIVAAVPAQEFENDVDGYIHPSAQSGFLTSAEEQRRLAGNVRATNQSTRDHIQLPQPPTEEQELHAQEQWNQGRIGHYMVVIAERMPGSTKVKLSYMNSMLSYCKAYGEVNEVRGLARTIVCNSGWMAGQKPQWLEEDWTSVALQGGGNTCGFHTVLNTWAYMLGIKINVSARCTQTDYKSARNLINLALQGSVSSLEIEAWMQVHGYAAFKPSPESRNVTSSAHSVRMNEHILECHLDYLRDLETEKTCCWPAVPEPENQMSLGTLKRRQAEDFDENQRGNRRSRPSLSSPKPYRQAVNLSDDEDVSDFLPDDGDDSSECASNIRHSKSDSDSDSGLDGSNNLASNDHNGHANGDTSPVEQCDTMNCVVLIVTRLSGVLDLINRPQKGHELAERRDQLWEAFQLYRPDLFNGLIQPRRFDLLLDEVSSGKGAVTFHDRHKQRLPDLLSAPAARVFAVGTAVDGYITDPLGLRLLVGIMPHHEWILCLAVPVDHKRKDVRTLFSSINWPVRWGSWTFQILIETAERMNDGVPPRHMNARARELLHMWRTITVGKRGHAHTLLNQQGATGKLWEYDDYRALCPHRQRNSFPLLEQHAGNVLGLEEISGDECNDCQCLACRDVGYVREFHVYTTKGITLECRFDDCTYTTEDRIKYKNHEQSHYRNDYRKTLTEKANKIYHCRENGCTYSHTQWGCLHSHSRIMHCKNAKGYYCPLLWCTHNKSGFYRKDTWLKHMHKSHSELSLTEVESLWRDLNTNQRDAIPNLRRRSSSPPKECFCITCLDLGSNRYEDGGETQDHYPCRLLDCNFSAAVRPEIEEFGSHHRAELDARKHEKNHFRHEGQFRCIEDRCVYGAKRWSDLKRHYTSKHCLDPKTKFPCPEIDCKYGGNNGFTRKDKLKSHREKVHEKHARPEKRFRVSKNNAQDAA